MKVGAPEESYIKLGPANPSAVKRMAIYVQNYLNSGKPIPRSPLGMYIARRITDPDDAQDTIMAVSGPRGAGKSYTCLYLGCRIAEEEVRILGGKPEDYFNPDTNTIALEDSQCIAELLANKTKYQVILIDDGSVGLNAHDWNSKSSKNFIRIATTMRTRRWCILINSPQSKNLDVSLRDFLQMSAEICGSYHAGGFNLLHINSHQISSMGKTYRHRLQPDKHRIDLWAAFRPSADIVKRYDKVREESAIRLNERIAETGDSRIQKPKDGKSKAEKNCEAEIERYGDTVRSAIAADPSISLRNLSARTCLPLQSIERMLVRMDLHLKPRPPGRPKLSKEVGL